MATIRMSLITPFEIDFFANFLFAYNIIDKIYLL